MDELFAFIMDLNKTQLVAILSGVVTILAVLVVTIFGLFIHFNIRKIQKKYFALLRRFLDDMLYHTYNKSVELLIGDATMRWEGVGTCPEEKRTEHSCVHLGTSYTAQILFAKNELHRQLIINNREECLTSLRENGYEGLDHEHLEKRITEVGTRIYKKAEWNFEESGLYTLPLFTTNRPTKFQVTHAVDAWRPVVNEYLNLKIEERKEVKRLFYFPLLFWKWFAKGVTQ